MLHQIFAYPLGYASLLLETVLPFYIWRRGYLARLRWVTAYLLCLAVADGLRAGMVHAFGFTSPQYAYAYWLSDFGINIAAFLLVCAFFSRASSGRHELWKHLRLLLVTVSILLVGVSSFALVNNYDRLVTRFIVEFNQNLYFTCLVLTTLLFLFLMQTKNEDDQLVLLVSGLGIYFAGPAASLALFHLTSGEGFARALATLVIPGCNVAMLLIWFYTIARVPASAPQPAPELSDSRVRGNERQVALEVSSGA